MGFPKNDFTLGLNEVIIVRSQRSSFFNSVDFLALWWQNRSSHRGVQGGKLTII